MSVEYLSRPRRGNIYRDQFIIRRRKNNFERNYYSYLFGNNATSLPHFHNFNFLLPLVCHGFATATSLPRLCVTSLPLPLVCHDFVPLVCHCHCHCHQFATFFKIQGCHVPRSHPWQRCHQFATPFVPLTTQLC